MSKQIKHGPEFVSDELSNRNVTRMFWWFIGFISGIIAFALLINENPIKS